MQIAINVNDSSIAHKILNYLSNFKNDVDVTSFESGGFDIQFQKDKETLSKQIDEYKNDKAELLDAKKYNEEMELFLSKLKEQYANS
ncbi:MAG: hypothetical protein PHX44_07530 [Sulfurimonas sp.]|uniref:hypothetical protein n=1 Tax=Sulfurimonas sp. TaxID=2022749 RepID=UPI002627B629|nr:hypothetical protein [Sulfurimonas sp.]MDD2652885.1 hypothetical protein [Sulfurimonas sp.]MDD3452331.1 hypothetical protein [Sulfurimonas sp.]